MIILSAKQIKEWDQYTIHQEPIAPLALMERAAQKCASWIEVRTGKDKKIKLFAAKGNNGGDGLAIARILFESGYDVSVFVLEWGKLGTPDFQSNLQRLHLLPIPIQFIQNGHTLPQLHREDVVIDAIFGIGLKGPLDSLTTDVVKTINLSKAEVISIDLPTGISADDSSEISIAIEARFTLSFQCYKLALLVSENALNIGKVVILDIGLHPGYLQAEIIRHRILTKEIIQNIFKPSPIFGHKGNFGHGLLITGSYGKMGAAVLCTQAALRCGIGLVSCFVPTCGYEIMQISAPEAMVITDENEKFVARLPDDIDKYQALGIGPGLGIAEETKKLISFVVRRCQKPLVLDADALNCLSSNPELLHHLPAATIITPHPREFDRLFGPHQNDIDRIKKAKKMSVELKTVIVLKGHHTLIAAPDSKTYFNNNGNAGMAKGGSGDILTGMITAFLAQGYLPLEAAVMGVYLHGLAGDLAAAALSQEAMKATDLIHFLPPAFLCIGKDQK
ncbi:MAG: bifunctional ADP-dependent NAD(P)H-hydrate dehydratase/NAD(P)H-hydrate epimerase [Flavisolibacter sp.]